MHVQAVFIMLFLVHISAILQQGNAHKQDSHKMFLLCAASPNRSAAVFAPDRPLRNPAVVSSPPFLLNMQSSVCRESDFEVHLSALLSAVIPCFSLLDYFSND